MNVHISYKIRKTRDIEKEINHFTGKLQKRLQAFRPELIHLKGVFEENSPPQGFVVSLNLRLPSGQMAAQKSAPTAAAAVKSSFDDLLQQLTKHKELLRNSHKWMRRRSGNGRALPQVPFEQTLASVQPLAASSDDIRSYINANLRRLERFVERELYFREAAGQLEAGDVAQEEVVDEAVARALTDGAEKPERLALEPWLYRLALRAMSDLAARGDQQGPEVHLEDRVRRPNVRASDEPQLQFHQPDESFTEETVIADRRTATPEDIAYSDEMLKLVEFALGGASRTDREAFILHTLEGFSVGEIAAITDRGAEQVSASIAAARLHLRRFPPLAGHFAAGAKKSARQTARVH
jgi:RNA polymerase sigma factor (sigma-70 family)